MIDIHDPVYAEALFHFVGQKQIFNDFCEKNMMQVSDMSFAEYVYKYKLDEFEKWLAESFPSLLLD